MNEKEKEYFRQMFEYLKRFKGMDEFENTPLLIQEIKDYLLFNEKEIEKCLD